MSIRETIRETKNHPFGKVQGVGESLSLIGDPAILEIPLLAVFGSSRCPARKMLQAHDLAHERRHGKRGIISGFHSPVEKEILTVLLGGTCPLVMVLGRGLEGLHIPVPWRIPLEQGRIVLVSPFDWKLKRPTIETAEKRNHFVADIADDILVIYAAEGGHLASQIKIWENAGKRIQRL